MKKVIPLFLVLAGIVPLACENGESPSPSVIELTYGFESNEEEWTGGFCDLPEDGLEIYDLDISYAPLPEETRVSENSIRIQGHNRSDDLFMFLKKYLTGLEPLTAYRITFEIELASQYPKNSAGIGGSPGGAVFLKAGATTQEPITEVLEVSGRPYLQMNIDKGNQSQDGTDMYNIGTIGIEGEEFEYELITRSNDDRPLQVSTDSDGDLWLIVGTDSGFEGLTVLFYNKIRIRLAPII